MAETQKYGKVFDSLPIEVVYHLKNLIKNTGLPDDPKSFNRFMESWLIKRVQFDKIVEQGNYRKEKIFNTDDKNSCIAMTLSGSLVTLGPLTNGTRTATYTSIGMRTDVPMVKIKDKSVLGENIEINKAIVFEEGPVKSTSTIIDMAVMPLNPNNKNQAKELSDSNNLLIKKFLSINRDFLSDKHKESDLINRNDLFDKWIILTWFRIGGMDEFIFYARAKLLWLELFLKFYDHLSSKGFSPEKRDELFLELTNVTFGHYIDVYKWLESEKKDFDIGLLSALEDIPELESYIQFGKDFYNKFP